MSSSPCGCQKNHPSYWAIAAGRAAPGPQRPGLAGVMGSGQAGPWGPGLRGARPRAARLGAGPRGPGHGGRGSARESAYYAAIREDSSLKLGGVCLPVKR